MKKILVAVLLIISVFACGKAGKNKDAGKEKGETKNEQSKKNTDNTQNEIEKYNTYVEIYNSLADLDGSVLNYTEFAGDKEEMKIPKSDSAPSLYNSISERDLENLKTVMNSKPSMPELDTAAQKLAPVLEELSKLMAEAKEYYEAKDYKDDDYARGKELHKLLIIEFSKYTAASQEYKIALQNKAKEVKKADMEKAKKDGHMIAYYKMEVMQASEDLINEIDMQSLNAGNVTTGDLSKIKPLYDKLTEAQKNLREVAKDDKALEKEGYKGENMSSLNKSNLDSFIRSTMEFKECAVELTERIEKKEKVDQFKLEHNMMLDREDGTPESLYRIYSELIKEYNRGN